MHIDEDLLFQLLPPPSPSKPAPVGVTCFLYNLFNDLRSLLVSVSKQKGTEVFSPGTKISHGTKGSKLGLIRFQSANTTPTLWKK